MTSTCQTYNPQTCVVVNVHVHVHAAGLTTGQALLALVVLMAFIAALWVNSWLVWRRRRRVR